MRHPCHSSYFAPSGSVQAIGFVRKCEPDRNGGSILGVFLNRHDLYLVIQCLVHKFSGRENKLDKVPISVHKGRPNSWIIY
jgi:hypothetical protein